MTPTVKCDECGWTDEVATIRHLRAWFRAACPICGNGEIIDATECRVVEELIALEREGLVQLDDGSPLTGTQVRAVVNTAREPIFQLQREGGGQ